MFDLIWTARFKDGSEICQYDKDGKENLFKEVLDNRDNLAYFALVRRKDMYTYLVDLQRGCISAQVMGQPVTEPRVDMLRKADYTYRLIYFREVARHFDSSLRATGEPSYAYFLGFQYTDSNDCNQKRIMKILPNGDFVIN